MLPNFKSENPIGCKRFGSFISLHLAYHKKRLFWAILWGKTLKKKWRSKSTRQTHFFKMSKNSFTVYNFGLFQQVFENLKLNKLVKEERRSDLEDRIWRLKFGKTHFLSCWISKNEFETCTFERLAFISLGGGRNAQVGKTSLLEVNLYGASVDVERIHFLLWYASGPGIPPKPSIFRRRRSIFLQCEVKIVRRFRPRQRFGVVSQQRLRPRKFDSTVKRVTKLRFEPVSFLCLVCL